MASYGVFLAACGFEHHAPRGHLAFAPRLTPEAFKCPFTTAEGWGSYAQHSSGGKMTASILLKWGTLRIKTLALKPSPGLKPSRVVARLNTGEVRATLLPEESQALISFEPELRLGKEGRLDITFS
jgi:hypothetical protein